MSKNINWVEGITLCIALAGTIFVGFQYSQTNKHKKWDNYNAMNAAYHNLYDNLYEGKYIGVLNKCSKITDLSSAELAWIRAYFDLYAEEHWLEIEHLIPKGMWSNQIGGGVNLNLKTHPVMIDGYNYWKDKGAFKHPPEFIPYVDKKLMSLDDEINKIKTEACNSSQDATVQSDK